MNPFRLAFNATTWRVKLIIIGLVLALMTITHGATYYIAYDKGKSISQTVISNYKNEITTLQSRINKGQGTINEQIVVKYVDRNHYIDKIVYQNHDVIRDVVVSRPSTVTEGWVYSHDQSVTGSLIDPALASNSKSSGIKDTDILQTVAVNYGTSLQNQNQIKSWQEWYINTKAMYDKFSADRKATELKK